MTYWDSGDYSYEISEAKLGGALIDVFRKYDARTCAERHDEQFAALVEHVHALTVLYTQQMEALTKRIEVLEAQLGQ